MLWVNDIAKIIEKNRNAQTLKEYLYALIPHIESLLPQKKQLTIIFVSLTMIFPIRVLKRLQMKYTQAGLQKTKGTAHNFRRRIFTYSQR